MLGLLCQHTRFVERRRVLNVICSHARTRARWVPIVRRRQRRRSTKTGVLARTGLRIPSEPRERRRGPHYCGRVDAARRFLIGPRRPPKGRDPQIRLFVELDLRLEQSGDKKRRGLNLRLTQVGHPVWFQQFTAFGKSGPLDAIAFPQSPQRRNRGNCG